MSAGPNPTWYDVLGLPRDATPAEIKTAWRSATDKFEPGSGSGQFRMFNDAADVLLDPERRRAYDASLAREERHEGSPAPATVAAADEGTPPPPQPEPPAAVAPEPDADAGADRPAERATRGAVLLAGALAVLLVAALAVAGYFLTQVQKDSRVADARNQAPAAAERAAKAILSYDYRRLETDRERAVGFLTDSYEKDFLETFALLEKNKDGSAGAAVQTKAVVSATVVGSGVVDAEDGVVRVLLYVNQVSRKAEGDPQVFQNRVAMTMEKDGNKWLVDDLKSY